jgi:hypothetical protein
MIELTPLESKVSKVQKEILNRRGNLTSYFENEILREYAQELAAHYFKKSKNESYLEPIIRAFTADLILAPLTHLHAHLYRYNYDELDILANFYRFTNNTNKYFHATTGILPPATLENFQAGLEHLHIQLDNTEELFNTYLVEGLRAKLAARLIESIAYLEHDKQLNRRLGFMDNIDIREKSKREGRGKFRYLRRGAEWIALGTAPNQTIDLRYKPLEAFGYSITIKKIKTRENGKTNIKHEVRATVAPHKIEHFKRETQDHLHRDASINFRLRIANDHYRKFYQQYKHATSTRWKQIDMWHNRATDKALKGAGQRPGWKNFQAAELKHKIVFPPARTNFFWNPAEELHCEYKQIWNPYTS